MRALGEEACRLKKDKGKLTKNLHLVGPKQRKTIGIDPITTKRSGYSKTPKFKEKESNWSKKHKGKHMLN